MNSQSANNASNFNDDNLSNYFNNLPGSFDSPDAKPSPKPFPKPNAFKKQHQADFSELTPGESASVFTGEFRQKKTHKKTNLEILHEFFNIEQRTYEDEDDLIIDIRQDRSINWKELSKKKRIPEFILDEFENKFNWENIFFYTGMVRRVIKKFKPKLLDVTNSDTFYSNFTNESENAIDMLVEIADKTILGKVFDYCCQNKLGNLVRYYYENDIIDVRKKFTKAINDNNYQLVKVILKNTDLKPTHEQLNNAFRNNNFQLVELILNNSDLKLTQDHLNGAIKDNNFQLVEIILKNTDLKPTQDHLNNAFRNNNYQLVEFIFKNTDLKPTQNHLNDVIKDNNFQLVDLILKHSNLKPTQDHLNTAIHNNYYRVVEIILKNIDLKPTQDHLNTAINKNYYQLVEIILENSNLVITEEIIHNILYSEIRDNGGREYGGDYILVDINNYEMLKILLNNHNMILDGNMLNEYLEDVLHLTRKHEYEYYTKYRNNYDIPIFNTCCLFVELILKNINIMINDEIFLKIALYKWTKMVTTILINSNYNPSIRLIEIFISNDWNTRGEHFHPIKLEILESIFKYTNIRPPEYILNKYINFGNSQSPYYITDSYLNDANCKDLVALLRRHM